MSWRVESSRDLVRQARQRPQLHVEGTYARRARYLRVGPGTRQRDRTTTDDQDVGWRAKEDIPRHQAAKHSPRQNVYICWQRRCYGYCVKECKIGHERDWNLWLSYHQQGGSHWFSWGSRGLHAVLLGCGARLRNEPEMCPLFHKAIITAPIEWSRQSRHGNELGREREGDIQDMFNRMQFQQPFRSTALLRVVSASYGGDHVVPVFVGRQQPCPWSNQFYWDGMFNNGDVIVWIHGIRVKYVGEKGVRSMRFLLSLMKTISEPSLSSP